MKTTPTAAMGVFLRLPPLQFMTQAKAQVGINRLMCTQQWRLTLKSTNFGHIKKPWDMVHKPIL